eukprot:gene11968-13960_t
MSSLLRVAVSKQKRRYQKNGYDLDLASMGFPSEKVEGVFRNPMKEVQRFLENNHKDHYRVYNLCSERDYDHNKFHGRVGVYPFDDHNAPAFELIEEFCRDVDEWMKADSHNIAVIHCKAGKGRTGLMICCWLLYCRMWENTEESLRFYAALRTYNQKGVTIPSQIRYVHYFGRSIREKVTFPRPVVLRKLVLKPLPHEINLSDITFNVSIGKNVVYNTKLDVVSVTVHKVDKKLKKKKAEKKAKADKGSSSSSSSTASLEGTSKNGSSSSLTSSRGGIEHKSSVGTMSKGSKLDHTNSTGTISNFDYQTYYQNSIMGKKEVVEELDEYISFDVGSIPMDGDVRVEVCNKAERMFMFWIHTSFVSTQEIVTKPGLDKAHKDKNHKLYPEDFRVELLFEDIVEVPETTTVVACDESTPSPVEQPQTIINTITTPPPAITIPSSPQADATTPIIGSTPAAAPSQPPAHKDETDSSESSDITDSSSSSDLSICDSVQQPFVAST